MSSNTAREPKNMLLQNMLLCYKQKHFERKYKYQNLYLFFCKKDRKKKKIKGANYIASVYNNYFTSQFAQI